MPALNLACLLDFLAAVGSTKQQAMMECQFKWLTPINKAIKLGRRIKQGGSITPSLDEEEKSYPVFGGTDENTFSILLLTN